MDDAERRLPASPRRREWARSQGYSARSSALTASLSVTFAAVLWLMSGQSVLNHLTTSLRERLSAPLASTLTIDSASDLILRDLVTLGMFGLWGLLAIWAATAVSSLVQTGFQWAPVAASPQWSRLSPGPNTFSTGRNLVTGLWNLLLMSSVGIAAWLSIRSGAGAVPGFAMPLKRVAQTVSGSLATTALQLCGVLIAVCLLDLVRRRWQFERSLMMTDAEQKEEADHTPATRKRRRQA